MHNIELNNGVMIPAIGYGTYKATNQDGYSVILDAIRAGYRHLDTAKVYENEEEVGRAVRESGIPREEFFLTSKLDRNLLGYENAKRELDRSLMRLGTEYLDLYLMHWPRADYGKQDFDRWETLDIETWRAFEELQETGKIRAIGVSNFLVHHLENLLPYCKVIPAVNQLELHPGYLQEETVAYCRDRGIVPEAWSPIGRSRLRNNALLVELAEKYNTTVAHLCLVFDYAEGFVVLPKSSQKARMEENLNLTDLTLSDADRDRIRNMAEAGWSGEHPDRETVAVPK